ncbi:MAG: tRNA (adenosine(37)-N6)-threonylcarbamoyltransferase complex dimerization subunit type 1 TsaB [Candidatus Babeliales bacterium]
MQKFLIFTNDYLATNIALYHGTNCMETHSEPDKRSSKYLISFIQKVLEKNRVSLHELDFIAVNQGPGKFTALRVILATANGLSFAAQIPLIGLDGIKALLDEFHTSPITVALLNAFNNDAFFGIAENALPYETGYQNIEELLHTLKQNYTKKITFIGDGATLFAQEIHAILGEQASMNKKPTPAASLNFLAKIALKKWHEKQTTDQLMPLYLKKPHYKKAIE